MKFQASVLILVVLISLFLFHITQSPQSGIATTTTITGASAHPSTIVISEGDRSPGDIFLELTTHQTAHTSQSYNSSDNTHTSVVAQPATKSISACSISAPLYSVYTLNGQHVLIGQDVDHQWSIASISKLMTAIVASKYLDADALVVITDEDHENTQGYNTFTVGSSYRVRDLIKAALMVSSNDATYALARSFGYNAFINRMNEEARMLHMNNTSFSDPSGLTYLNQSTLSDLSLLMAYLYRSYNSLLSITRQRNVTITDVAHKKNTTLTNIDYFAGEPNFIGGKTGYITESGENLVTLFSHGDAVWMVGVMGSTDRFSDVRALLRCAQEK